MVDEAHNRDENDLDRVRSDAQAELKRMSAELTRLSGLREDAVERVMRDNNDRVAHTRMKELDDRIESLKRETNEFRKQSVEAMNQLRIGIETRRQETLDRLQGDLANARVRQETLQSDLIPAAMARLEGFQEEKRSLDAKTLTLMSRINEMRRLEFDAGLLELD